MAGISASRGDEHYRSKENLQLKKPRQQACMRTLFRVSLAPTGPLFLVRWYRSLGSTTGRTLTWWPGAFPQSLLPRCSGYNWLERDFKIDLVDPETCRPGLRTAIERYEGRTLMKRLVNLAKIESLVGKSSDLFSQIQAELLAFAEFLQNA